VRERIHLVRRKACEQRLVMLGEDRVEHRDQASCSDEDREDERRARPGRRMTASKQRARKPSERRGKPDGADPARRVERVVRRHLAHDQHQDSRREVGPDTDAEREQQRRGQPLDARPVREQSQQQRAGAPDEEVHRQGDRRVTR